MSKENHSHLPVKGIDTSMIGSMHDDTPADSSSQCARSDGWRSSEHEQVRSPPTVDHSSDFKKRDRRLAMNRVTARERRRRKKQHLEDLEREVGKLQATGDSLKRENQLLRISITKLASSMRDGQGIPATPAANPLVQALTRSPPNLNHSLTQALGVSTSNPTAISTQLLIHQLNQARQTLAVQSTVQEIGHNMDALNSFVQQVANVNNNAPLNPETNSAFNLQEIPLSALIQQNQTNQSTLLTNQSTLNGISGTSWSQENNVTSILTPTTAGLSMGQNDQSLAGLLAQQRIQQLHQRIQPTLNQASSTECTQEKNDILGLDAKSKVPAPSPN